MRGPSPMKVTGGASPGVGGTLFGKTQSPKGGGLPAVGFGGKGSRQQALAGPGAKATLGGGNPLSQSLGQYGKGHSFSSGSPGVSPAAGPDLSAGLSDPASVNPTMHPGVSVVRDGSGGIRAHPRQGGLGPTDNSAGGTDI